MDDDASIHSRSFSTPDLSIETALRDAKEEADLKRLALFLLNELADLLERAKKCVVAPRL